MLREDQLDPDDPSGPESGSGFCHLHLSLLTDYKLNSYLWILLNQHFTDVLYMSCLMQKRLKTGVISQTLTLGPYLSSVSESH